MYYIVDHSGKYDCLILVLWLRNMCIATGYHHHFQYCSVFNYFIDWAKGSETGTNNLLVILIKNNNSFYAYEFKTKENIK